MEKILTELKVKYFCIQLVELGLECTIRIRIAEPELDACCINYAVSDIIRQFWIGQRISQHMIHVMDNLFVSIIAENGFFTLSASVQQAKYATFDSSHGTIRVVTSAAWQSSAQVAPAGILLCVKLEQEDEIMREIDEIREQDYLRELEEIRMEHEMFDDDHIYD